MKRAIVFLILLAATAVLFGQENKTEQTKPAQDKAQTDKAQLDKNPVTTVVKEMLERQQKNLTAAVAEMPADKFGYKPTPEQMTFGHLVFHMATSNIELCSKAGNMPPPPLGRPAQETDKESLLALLNKSFLYCNAALAHVDDSKLGETIEVFGGRQAPRAFALIALTNDWADHYSAAATYLRLNGLLPPTAQPKK